MCLSVNQPCTLSSLIISTPQFLSYLDGEDTRLLLKVNKTFANLISEYREKGVVPPSLIHDFLKPREMNPGGNLDKKLIAYATQRWGSKYFKKEVELLANMYQKRGYFIVNGVDGTSYINASPEILENASQVYASREENEIVFNHMKEDLTLRKRDNIQESLPEGVIEIPAGEDGDEILKHLNKISVESKAHHKNRVEFENFTFVLNKKVKIVGSSSDNQVSMERWDGLNSRGPWDKMVKIGSRKLLLENSKEILLVSPEGDLLGSLIKDERKIWISDAACIGGGYLAVGIKNCVRLYRLEDCNRAQGTKDYLDLWQLNSKGRIQRMFFLKNGVLILAMSTSQIFRISPFFQEKNSRKRA